MRKPIIFGLLISIATLTHAHNQDEVKPGTEGASAVEVSGTASEADADLKKAASGEGDDALDAFITAVIRHKATDVTYVERLAQQFLGRGLIDETKKLIVGFANQYPAKANSPILGYLLAEADLMRYEFGQVPQLNSDFKSPDEKLDEQLDRLREAQNGLRSAIIKLDESRTKKDFDVQRYHKLRGLFLRLEARILMAKGDMSFRLTPPSLSSQLAGGPSNPLAMTDYRNARERLYLEDNVASRALADDVELRIGWLLEGRFFGGSRYFEVEPVMGSEETEWSPLATLKRLMDSGNNNGDSILAAKSDWQNAVTLAKREVLKLNKELLENSSRAEQRLQGQIWELSRELLRLQREAKQANVGDAEYVALRLERLRQDCYRTLKLKREYQRQVDELTKQRKEMDRELGARLNELAKIASQEIVKSEYKTFPDIPNSLSDPGLAEALKNFSNAKGTTIGKFEQHLKEHDLRILAIEKRIQAKRKQLEANKIELARRIAVKAEDQLKKEVTDLQKSIQDSVENFEEQATASAQQIAKVVKERIRSRRKQIQSEIDHVNGLIDEATRLIRDVQTAAKSAKTAITAARTAIIAAGKIPTGFISGTANGIFTNESTAMIEAAKAGAEVIKHAQATISSVQQAKTRLNKLKAAVREYEQKLKDIDFELIELAIKEDCKNVENQARAEKRNFKDLIDDRKNLIHDQIIRYRDFEAQITQIRSDVLDAESAELTAEKQAEVAAREATREDLEREKKQMRFLAGAVESLVNDLNAKAQKIDRLNAEVQKQTEMLDPKKWDERLKEKDSVEETRDGLRQTLDQQITLIEERRKALEKSLKDPSRLTNYPGLSSSAEQLAVSGTQAVKVSLRTYQKRLEEANGLLFQFANWLYLFSRDPEAQKWAVSCKSLEDAIVVYKKLEGIYKTVQGSVGRASYRLFAIELSREQIQASGIGDDHKFYVNVDPSLLWVRDFNSKAVNDVAYEKLVGKPRMATHKFPKAKRGPITIYQPFPIEGQEFLDGEVGKRPSLVWNNPSAPKGISTTGVVTFSELTFAPAVQFESGVHQVLWDVWVLPHWEGNFDLNLSKIKIVPVGATKFRRGNIFEQMPVILPYKIAASASTNDPIEMVTNWNDGAAQDVDLVSGTFKGLNCLSALGRGLGNTWEMTLPVGWTGQEGSPGLNKLKKVVVYFAYLTSPRKQLIAGGAAAVPVAARPDDRQPENRDREEKTAAALALEDLQARTIAADNAARQFRLARDNKLTNYETYESTPSAQASRLERLQLAAELLPTYAELYPPANGEASTNPAKTKFIADAEKLIPGSETSHKEQPGYDIKSLATQIIDNEVMSYSPSSAVLGPVELHNVWKTTAPVLSNPTEKGPPGLLEEMKKSHEQLKLADATLKAVVEALKPIQKIITRLDFERATSEHQKSLAEALVAGLSALAFNAKVNDRLLELDALTKTYSEPSTWIWQETNDDPTGKTLLKRLEAEFHAITKQLERRRIE